MISRIEGQLIQVDGSTALIRCGALTYEVLIPSASQPRLAQMVNETVELQTRHYLEGQSQGSSFIPRLIGFLTEEDRDFFELFITVKGLGVRKALRALQLPFARVAEAIDAKDIDLLKSMPEIGKRLAETIIVTLSGKVDRYVIASSESAGEDAEPDEHAELKHDAVAVLTMLGETKLQAVHLVERALAADADIDTADALVAAAYRLKELV